MRTTRLRATAVPAALTVLAIAMVGCSSSSTSAADAPLTRAAYVKRANAACSATDKRIGAVTGPVFSGGSAPTPDQLQTALNGIVSESRSLHTKLAALRPPAAMQARVHTMLRALDDGTAAAEAQGTSFFDNQDDPWAKANHIAAGLGLLACQGSD